MHNTLLSLFKESTIERYSKLLHNLRITEDTMVIPNDSYDHARAMISELLKSAKKEVRIYSTHFCDTFYSDPIIKNAFTDTQQANKQVMFKVILRSKNKEEQTEIAKYKELLGNNFEVKYNKKLIVGKEELQDFIVVDHKALRYEETTESELGDCHNKKPAIVKAVGCFNNPKYATKLSEKFDEDFNS